MGWGEKEGRRLEDMKNGILEVTTILKYLPVGDGQSKERESCGYQSAAAETCTRWIVTEVWRY